MLRHLRSERGVTLVELMVVVAIIAIIAAIAVTIFQDLQKKAKLGADQGSVGAMRSAVALYYGKNNGLFPATTDAVASLTTPYPTWNCAAPTYDLANGKISYTATVGNCP
jgi:prepilin-type N-terminal cleavage/methylation domain-containing protein